jgi:hypothetical protein
MMEIAVLTIFSAMIVGAAIGVIAKSPGYGFFGAMLIMSWSAVKTQEPLFLSIFIVFGVFVALIIGAQLYEVIT